MDRSRPCENHAAQKLFFTLLTTFLLAACGAAPWKPPVPVDQVEFKAYAISRTDGNVTVTVAIPGAGESELLFGTPLYKEGIQPVWIEVVNRGGKDYVLLKTGVDQDQFSPLEASYQRHSGDKDTELAMDRFFYDMAFTNPIESGQTESGFVYTNVDEGHKAINIDLLSDQGLKSFAFLVRVPGLVTDVDQVDAEELYDHWIDIDDESELRAVLESFPCCATNEDGSDEGILISIVVVVGPGNSGALSRIVHAGDRGVGVHSAAIVSQKPVGRLPAGDVEIEVAVLVEVGPGH